MTQNIIVIKIGSSVIIRPDGKLDLLMLDHIACQISQILQSAVDVVLVVSGAVACGVMQTSTDTSDSMYKWKINIRKQIAAGIGQVILTKTLYEVFINNQMTIAQILLTKNYLAHKSNRYRLTRILHSYIDMGIIPVINENDVVDLNSFGGNDYLAYEIARLLKSKMLLIVSTPEGSVNGVGGGEAKEKVINLLIKENIRSIIVDGKLRNVILQSVNIKGI